MLFLEYLGNIQEASALLIPFARKKFGLFFKCTQISKFGFVEVWVFFKEG